MYIVGPNDRPPAHSLDEYVEDEEKIDEEAIAALTED